MKRRCFSRAKFTLWAIAVIVVLSYVGKLQDNNEQNQKQISALKKVVADTQSMLSRAGLSVVEMQVIIESTGAMDFLSMSSELDKVEERRKLVAPNILAAMGNEECLSGSTGNGADIQMVDLYSDMTIKKVKTGEWMDGVINWTYPEESYKDQPLEVILMPHSHNDPGWLKTFEQYFEQDTNAILNNVVEFLEQNKKRKFVWAEISFFSLWWERASSSMRNRMKALVDEGRVEFVTAGWVMEDEANTYLYAMVDQIIEGNHFIKNNLGAMAKAAWSIDPFGQSSTVAYLRKRMGFKNMIVQRTHYLVKKYLANQRSLEFSWRQNWDSAGSTDMFTHMLTFNSYCTLDQCGPDKQVCCQFDFARLNTGQAWGCYGKRPIVVTTENVRERATSIVSQYKKKASIYKSNVILVAIGQDFSYRLSSECRSVFENNEKIMEYVNSHPEFNTHIRWGTLSEYFQLAHDRLQQSSQKISTLSGDFFTYSDRNDDYWSGYFTSRAFYKKLDRILEARLRSAEVIFSMANFLIDESHQYASIWKRTATELFKKLTESRRNLGVFQHHDGITGTAKDHVVMDYSNKLFNALRNANEVIASSGEYLISSSNSLTKTLISDFNSLVVDDSKSVPELNLGPKFIPIKGLIYDEKRVIVFYNSLGYQRQQIVSVIVDSADVEVQCAAGNKIHAQIAPKWLTDVGTLQMEANVFELFFTINMAPLSLNKYFIVHKKQVDSKVTARTAVYAMRVQDSVDGRFPQSGFKIVNTDPRDFKLSNYHYILSFGDNGLLKSIEDRNTDKVMRVGLSFAAYQVKRGGAYLFYPGGPPTPLPSLAPPMVVERGPLFSRVTVKLDNMLHSIRLHNSPGLDGYSIMVSNLVDVRPLSNRELAMRIDGTELMRQSNGVLNKRFFTDLNGFQMQGRQFLPDLPLQASFFPMPSQMIINSVSGASRLSVHSAQSAGAGIGPDGMIDIILDRRLNQDDARGVGQGVRDNKLTPNDFWIVPEFFTTVPDVPTDASNYAIRPTLLSQQANLALNNPLIPLVPSEHQNGGNMLMSSQGYAPLSIRHLPCDVHLLNFRTMSLEPKEALMIFHRFGHSCRVASSGNLAPTNCSLTDGEVKLDKFLKPATDHERLKFTEYTLNGIQRISETFEERIQIKPFEINTYLVEKEQS